MAITVKKVGEVAGDELMATTRTPRNFVVTLTSLEEAESNDGPQWNLHCVFGKGASARTSCIKLKKIISAQKYSASLDSPVLLPIPDHCHVSQFAIFRDRFFEIYPIPRHISHTEEAFLRIKREVYAEDVGLTSLKSFVANVEAAIEYQRNSPKRELIPDDVKMLVWARDCGACTRCGSTSQLHFDHIIPVAKGGSNLAQNIQLLCQECNLRKSDKIAF